MAKKRVQVRRDAGAWEALVERQRRSGVAAKAFCEREGLSRSSFERWRARLASRAAAAPTARFLELVPGPEPSAEERWGVELALPSGLILRLRG